MQKNKLIHYHISAHVLNLYFKATLLFLFCLCFLANSLTAENISKEQWKSNYNFDQNLINSLGSHVDSYFIPANPIKSESKIVSGIQKLRRQKAQFENFSLKNKDAIDRMLSNDTLIIGIPPNDSLVITGNFTYNGTIVVALNGKLIFRNANAKIIGNLIVFNNGTVTADSSYLYFPQVYFYQRLIFALDNAKINIQNTTLDFSNLSHTMATMGKAEINFKNVTNKGFTTTGLYGQSKINIDGTNEAGEFILIDTVNLAIKNATTALLWHHAGKGAIFDIKFPAGDSLASYVCNSSIKGISGINYNVNIENCQHVMWGLMPDNGSDITISDSKIRTIGLWFSEKATANLTSLANNSTYTDFKLPYYYLNLHLVNSSVDTWSLYPMDNSNITVTGCIVGEVGSEKHSVYTLNKTFCDGSGGYLWGTDTTFSVIGFSAATTSVRSQGNAIVVFAYSALTMGQASATENSVMMVLQSSLPEEPVAYDNGCVWYARIDKPSVASVNSNIALIGSVWINKTPTSKLMDFDKYSVFYHQADDDPWLPVSENNKRQVHSDTLALWNTKGLRADNYRIKIVLFDNFGDSVEAVSPINLMPEGMNVEDEFDSEMKLIPNPVSDRLVLQLKGNLPPEMLSIYDLQGNLISSRLKPTCDTEDCIINIGGLNVGTYFLLAKWQEKSRIFKFNKF